MGFIAAWIESSQLIFYVWLSCKSRQNSHPQLDVHLTGDQEVMGLIPARSSNILSWKFIMKYFL